MGVFGRFFGSAGRRQQEERARAAEARKRLEALAEEHRQRRAADEAAELEAGVLEDIAAAQFPPPHAQELSAAEEWATSGEWLSVSSSNVRAIRYDHEDERLEIEYKDGSFYAYHPVSFDLALSLYDAPSKGTWVWDHLRVRGVGHIHDYQIPYEFISGPSSVRRKWMRSEESRLRHGRQGKHLPGGGK